MSISILKRNVPEKIVFFLLIILNCCFISCFVKEKHDVNENNNISIIKRLTDKRFCETFTSTKTSVWGNTFYAKLIFDGTNKFYYQEIFVGKDGFAHNSYEFVGEIVIDSSGRLRYRQWNDHENHWSSWMKYEFGAEDRLWIEGDSLLSHIFYFTNESYDYVFI